MFRSVLMALALSAVGVSGVMVAQDAHAIREATAQKAMTDAIITDMAALITVFDSEISKNAALLDGASREGYEKSKVSWAKAKEYHTGGNDLMAWKHAFTAFREFGPAVKYVLSADKTPIKLTQAISTHIRNTAARVKAVEPHTAGNDEAREAYDKAKAFHAEGKTLYAGDNVAGWEKHIKAMKQLDKACRAVEWAK